jgi:Mg2+-importing ATPase
MSSIGLEGKNISDYENNMDFIALIALFDPIRKTVKYSLDTARKLGLQVKIITGDDSAIAGNIALQIDLIRNIQDIVTGEEFAIMSDKEKERIAQVVSVFARFLPEQKYEIIKILKKGKSVGYLGDGINDAPALKEADVGFAVQGAVDIAKDAADIILLKKSLITVVEGIIIGRTVFVNTFNYLKITLASNLGNFFSIAAISLFIPFLPLLPLQILLVNLLSDSPMIAISTDNVSAQELACPTSYNLKHLIVFILIFGVISSIFDFVFFFKFYKLSYPGLLQTNWFIFSILTEVLFIFSGRTKKLFIKALRPSYWLLSFSIITILSTIIIPFTEIGKRVFSFVNPSFSGILIIFGIGAAYFISCEIFKLFYYKFIYPNNNY